MIKRQALDALQAWKESGNRKPMLIDGARQVGKTYLVEKIFGPQNFRQVIKFDFWKDDTLEASLFSASLDPEDVIDAIELTLGITFDPTQDLLFFDEIGHSQRAMDSLKYFAEERPDIWLCASGSNIGLLGSFPVGKVEQLHLAPLCFEEFLMAADEAALVKAYRGLNRTLAAYNRLMPLLLDYFYVGGMPEAVAYWFGSETASLHERTQGVASIQDNLLAAYERDFGKITLPSRVSSQQLITIFRNVPQQLSHNIDSSVKRYQFKDVIKGKRRYADLQSPIETLIKLCLLSKNFPIRCEPKAPLKAYRDENYFKLFFFDIGLLGRMLDLGYLSIREQNFPYKGYLAENFVHNELITGLPEHHRHSYSWHESNAEVEFIYAASNSSITPIEVKSGRNTKAKALQSYINRYAPARTVKLIASVGAGRAEPDLVWPLYFAGHVRRTLET